MSLTPKPASCTSSQGAPLLRYISCTGPALNLIGAVLITAVVFLLGKFVLSIDIGVMPDWASGG